MSGCAAFNGEIYNGESLNVSLLEGPCGVLERDKPTLETGEDLGNLEGRDVKRWVLRARST